MNKKIEKLSQLLSQSNMVFTNESFSTISSKKGFDISISTSTPSKENEISFDNIYEAASVIHSSENIMNKHQSDTELELTNMCKLSNIDPNNKITIEFLLS